MGGAVSAGREQGAPSEADLNALPSSIDRGEVHLFYTIPQDESLKEKSDKILLEISHEGFRLLKAESQDPLYFFPWGQIHSWAHTSGKFIFKYYEDRLKQIMVYSLYTRDVLKILEHIQHWVDTILNERRSQAVSDEAFTVLVERLQTSPPGIRLQLLASAARLNFFLSTQARVLVDLIDNSFDKVEAATILHGKLIDQNHFSIVLESLPHQDDRENVWHRISSEKRVTAR